VVLEELYAGVNRRDRHVIEGVERDFSRVDRILVPSLLDWVNVGKVLAQVAAEYSYELTGLGRLTNDALIAMSAARHGITVITAKERDFALLARIRPFRYQLSTI
jgi:predicted nucleic acid-binding protein